LADNVGAGPVSVAWLPDGAFPTVGTAGRFVWGDGLSCLPTLRGATFELSRLPTRRLVARLAPEVSLTTGLAWGPERAACWPASIDSVPWLSRLSENEVPGSATQPRAKESPTVATVAPSRSRVRPSFASGAADCSLRCHMPSCRKGDC
jgi:hypothetical protein